MTQEEKAKAYDEALERAREWKKKYFLTTISPDGTMAKDFALIFPVLAESENERMVKAITHILYENYTDAAVIEGVEIAEIVTWLEKQKEIPEKEYVFRPLAGTDITIAAEQAIRRAMWGDHLVLAFNGWYIPVDKQATTKGLVDSYNNFIKNQKYEYEVFEPVESTLEYKMGFKAGQEAEKLSCGGSVNVESDYDKGWRAGHKAGLKDAEQQKLVDLQVKGDGIYKICPHCKERMIRDDSKVYTSIPPQYGYNCPKCGAFEFDTVIYDSPTKEEQKPILKFKVGDKVHFKGDDVNVLTITGLREDAYLTDSAYGPILFSDQYEWEIVEQKPVEIHIDNPNIQQFDPDVKVTTSDSSASGKELLYVSNKSYNIGYRDGVNSVKPVEKLSKEEYVKRFKSLCDIYEVKLPELEYDTYHLCNELYKLSIDSGKQKPVEESGTAEPDYGICDDYIPASLHHALKRHGWYATHVGEKPDKEVIKYVETTIEQKSAEWSEDIIRKAVKEVGLTQHQIDWFKTNVFPPKQEWSEEDEEILGKLHRLIILCREDMKYIKPEEYNLLDSWLKDLHLNLKKRNEAVDKLCSNEWSEEDENNFYWISTRIQQANMTPEYSQKVYEILDWLKSKLNQN